MRKITHNCVSAYQCVGENQRMAIMSACMHKECDVFCVCDCDYDCDCDDMKHVWAKGNIVQQQW